MPDSDSFLNVEGVILPGFEAVGNALRHCVTGLGEAGLAVCAYVDGRPVVDAWCGAAGAAPWQRDTLVVTWSCTKGPTALCAQMLVDRGLLDVEAPTARYWPDFAAAGKTGALVGHLLDHTVGVIAFPGYHRVLGLDGGGLRDWDLVTRGLAAAPPGWAPGTRSLYHALSFGYLAGELVRRVDGRSPGRFFAEEVAAPLGLDFWIGLPAEHLRRVTPCIRREGTALPANQMAGALGAARDAEDAARSALDNGDIYAPEALPYSLVFGHPDGRALEDMFTDDEFLTAEIPAGNGVGTARGLARMYAALAMGGALDGVRLLSPATIELATRPRSDIGATPMGLGYQLFDEMLAGLGPGSGTFGHGGASGALCFADPVHRVGFAVTKNRMSDSASSFELVRALYSSL